MRAFKFVVKTDSHLLNVLQGSLSAVREHRGVSMKREIMLGQAAIAAFVLASGCLPPPGPVSTTSDFTADFLQVNPIILPPTATCPQPANGSGSTGTTPCDLTETISGHGYVYSAVTDPDPTTGGGGSGQASGATGGSTSSSGSTGSGSTGSGSGGTTPPTPVPNPIPIGDSIAVDFSAVAASASGSTDPNGCLAKAEQAAEQHLRLVIEGEGTIERIGIEPPVPVSVSPSSGSTNPPAPAPVPYPGIDTIVHATLISSCTLVPSCAAGDVTCCPAGAMCVPPPVCEKAAGCPTPSPTATPVANH